MSGRSQNVYRISCPGHDTYVIGRDKAEALLQAWPKKFTCATISKYGGSTTGIMSGISIPKKK
jgi:hypothetical protein